MGMPMYEYRCDACGHAFERYSAGKVAQERVEACPRCGKQRVQKVFSTFASSSCCGSDSAPASGGCGGGSGQFS
jgi:putative FmdB family regulatory protein